MIQPRNPRSLILLACLALAFVAPAAHAYALALRVMTYNIHHAAGDDAVVDVGRIADIINAANPDLVALQEVDQGVPRSGNVLQLNRLAELTGMQGYFGKTINLNGGAYGNGVLVRPGIEIVSKTNRLLPNPAGGEQRAIAELMLSLDANPTTAELSFFATHLDHSSAANRTASVQFINDLVAGSTTPAILAGDMNFKPASAQFALLDDQWTDATNVANPGITRANQIDYVFHRASNQWRVTTRGTFIVNAATNLASDHYPLLAVLDLPVANADFDADGDVDGADFLRWQRGAGDANGDEIVNWADLVIWQQTFGRRPSLAAVPEPSCIPMFCSACLLALRATHFRRLFPVRPTGSSVKADSVA